MANREIQNHSLGKLKKVPRIDTCRNKLLEIKIKSKQVVNNQNKRLIHSALIESLRSGKNLTSIARLNGKKICTILKGQNSI